MNPLLVDPTVFKQHSERQTGGDDNCKHYWIEESPGQWKCEICGRIISYERWKDAND
jgi:hypothetical protein